MKKKQFLVLALVIIVVISGFVYNYVFNSEHRDITNEEATVTLNAVEMFNQFQNDESTATLNYLDKVVISKGKITSIDNNEIVLDNVLQVNIIEESSSTSKEGDLVVVKGRCIGYDDLLEVVKIDQATLIK